MHTICLYGSSHKDAFPYCIKKCFEKMIASDKNYWNNCTVSLLSLIAQFNLHFQTNLCEANLQVVHWYVDRDVGSQFDLQTSLLKRFAWKDWGVGGNYLWCLLIVKFIGFGGAKRLGGGCFYGELTPLDTIRLSNY